MQSVGSQERERVMDAICSWYCSEGDKQVNLYHVMKQKNIYYFRAWGPWIGFSPWPFRNQAAQQEVSGGQNQIHLLHPGPWKNCLPWNWSLVPKRLETALLEDDFDCFLHLACVTSLSYLVWHSSPFSVTASSQYPLLISLHLKLLNSCVSQNPCFETLPVSTFSCPLEEI